MHSEQDLLAILWQIRDPKRPTIDPSYSLIQDAAVESWGRRVGTRLLRKVLLWEYHLWTTTGGTHAGFFAAATDGSLSAIIAQAYPVLRQTYDQQIDLLVGQIDLVYQRLVSDQTILAQAFNKGESLGALQACTWGAGDSHNGGQQVHILEFKSHKVVYKPRSLAVDKAFQSYLSWINQKAPKFAHQLVHYIDCGNYGWTEFVQFQETVEVADLERYYYRFGSLMAVVYSLAAVDFHHENLIANGEYPVLIDLESCLQPMRKVREKTAAIEAEESSVMDTAMLPSRLWNHNTKTSIDVGAISAQGGHLLPDLTEMLTGFTTGPLRLERIQQRSAPSKSRPDPLQRSPGQWGDAIKDGFAATYNLIFAHREWLLDESTSPLQLLTSCSVRFLPRNTYIYGKLLRSSYHPQLLQNQMAWDDHWRWLERNPPYADLPDSLNECEIRALKQGDIPYFTTQGVTGILESGNAGGACNQWQGVFARTPRENIRHRFTKKMSTSDLARQVWFIRTSLALLTEQPLPHRLNLGDTQALFRKVETLGGNNTSDPYWLTVRLDNASAGATAAIGRLGREADKLEIAGIGSALRYFSALHPSPNAAQWVSAHQGWTTKLPFNLSDYKFTRDLPVPALNRETLVIDLPWIQAVDELLNDPTQRLGLSHLFEQEVDLLFSTPNSVMTPTFSNGMAGLLYLSCRYHDVRLPSLWAGTEQVAR